jgi:hypothetical protein
MNTQVPSIDQNTIRRRGTGLRVLDPDRTFPGYTLFTPLTGQGDVYLIDLEGKVVHQWTLPYRPGLHGYLLPNGNLFYGGKDLEDQRFFPVWSNYRGGVLAEVDPQGTILWEHRSPDHHHDARRLRNGNVVLLGLEKIPRAFVPRIRGGIPGSEVDGDIYGDVSAKSRPPARRCGPGTRIVLGKIKPLCAQSPRPRPPIPCHPAPAGAGSCPQAQRRTPYWGARPEGRDAPRPRAPLPRSQAETPSEVPKPKRSTILAQVPGNAAGGVGNVVRQERTLGTGGCVSGLGTTT